MILITIRGSIHVYFASFLCNKSFQILVLMSFVPLRLIVRSGNSSLSAPLFDSDLDDVPERGLLSESSTLYLELTADSSSIPLLLALRYEGERQPLSFSLSWGLFSSQQKNREWSRAAPLSNLITASRVRGVLLWKIQNLSFYYWWFRLFFNFLDWKM